MLQTDWASGCSLGDKIHTGVPYTDQEALNEALIEALMEVLR